MECLVKNRVLDFFEQVLAWIGFEALPRNQITVFGGIQEATTPPKKKQLKKSCPVFYM